MLIGQGVTIQNAIGAGTSTGEMMDEETTRKEFEGWADCEGFHLSSYTEDGYKKYAADHTQTAWWAWLEATRRADRKARDEACRIIDGLRIADECSEIIDYAINNALNVAINRIRATIPEDQT